MAVFALDRNGRRVTLPDGMVCDLMESMFGGPLTVPPVSKWYKIPDRYLLHPRLFVAYVNFIDFIEEVGMDVVQNIIDDDHREPIWRCDSCGEPGVFERRCSNDCSVHDDCMVNWAALMARIGGCSECSATRDPRPLITPQFREQNREEWLRLWNLNRMEECPVCHEKPDMWDIPMNSDIPTRCTHWICVECWSRINDRDKRCPICRDDLTDWLSHFDNMSE